MKKPITVLNQLDIIKIRNDRLTKVSISIVKCDLGALGSVFNYARQELHNFAKQPFN